MAEKVQSILERMVPPLKDLRDRGLFTPTEIHAIVERRRRSEYLLQRRSAARLADYLRYIEDEILLEKLRKLRKEKVLLERRPWNEKRGRKRGHNHDDDDDDDDDDTNKRKHAYQISGIGDSHILSHIHFLYQRTLRKFHHPIDVLLNYAQFSKEHKSFTQLGRVYAEGLQRHPRAAGLWIEAASFEYFGYVARDDHNGSKDGGDVTSKVVGSSIRNARVLMQRGLRVNRNSEDLWLQYFALELHYVQKLRGRREILEDGVSSSSEEEEDDDKEGGKEMSSSLLPSQIIFKNAIRAIPEDVQFRLRFVEACRSFPQTEQLEEYIMDSVTRDFGKSVEGWVARISYAEEEWQRKSKSRGSGSGDENVVGFLGKADAAGGGEDDGSTDGSGDDGSEGVDRPAKKARVEFGSQTKSDPALALLQNALDAVPTPKMYLEGSRFLRMRIQRLVDNDDDQGNDDEEAEDDVSHLIGKDEDANGAARRHARLLETLYDTAREKGIFSSALLLDNVDFLLSTGQPQKAEELLSNTISTTEAKMSDDARLWLRWAEVSRQITEEAATSGTTKPSTSPTSILRRALKQTPIHERHSHTLILTELMQHLMMEQPSSSKTKAELKSLFQKLLLLSQGSNYSVAYAKKSKVLGDDNDEEDEIEDDKVNLASTFVAYLKFTMLDNTGTTGEEATADNDNAVRSIYTSILYHSNYGKSCAGKTEEETRDMKSFFDACIQFELAQMGRRKEKKKKKGRKMELCKLYETAIGFYANDGGGSYWRKVVDGYQRDLDDLKYSF